MEIRLRRWSGRALVLIALIGIGAGLLAPQVQADKFLTNTGSGAGQTLEPVGLEVDRSNGTLYVADNGNRRVDVFDSSGVFLRAFGWGVVASGPGNNPRNEIEKVEVKATGGSFTLLYVQNSSQTIGKIKQETASFPIAASSAEIQSGLEGLAAIDPGDVAVTGAAGGPWTIEFKGRYADTDLHPLEEGEASSLTGGAGELSISTTQLGAAYEVCEPPADACRAGQRGTQAGQLNPTGVAVDPATHAVYVFDGLETSSYNEAPNNRVQKFTPEGDFLYMLGGGVNVDTGEDICTASSGDTCGGGSKGTAAGEFDSENSSIAVDPSGVLYVNDGGRVQKFDSSGAPLGVVSLPGVKPGYLALDSVGNIYSALADEIKKYNPTGALLASLSVTFVQAIAVDEFDNLYATNQSSGRSGISRFDSSGALDFVFYSSSLGFFDAPEDTLVPYPPASEGDIYTVDQGRVNLITLPPPGPMAYPLAQTNFAGPIGNVRATLQSEVNPEGKATTYHYEYVEQQAFETEGGWASPEVEESVSSPIGSDFKLHQAKTVIGCVDPQTETAKCLTPETAYRFRVVASNADGTNAGPEGAFETKAATEIIDMWAISVGTSSASLHAEINPLGFATTGFFEVVTEKAFGESGFSTAEKFPAGTPLDFGAGEDPVERRGEASGLEPNTTYRYRLTVVNKCKPAEPTTICTFSSPGEAFRTFAETTEPPPCSANEAFRAGVAKFLLDCRAYEMVSPVEKNGTNVEVVFNVTGYPAGLDQSANGGERLTYSAYRAFAGPKSSPYTSQYLANRDPSSGWVTEAISPPREGPTLNIPAGLDYQFKAFTDDLCSGWLRQDTANPLLAPEAIAGYQNLYRRNNCQGGDYLAVTRSTEPLTSEPEDFIPSLQGFAADGSKSFFGAPDKLTPDANHGVSQVYEEDGQELHLVCILPNEQPSATGCSLGTAGSEERSESVFHAVSEDGSRVFFGAGGRLYLRLDGDTTIPVSGGASAEPAFFWGAAADGSRAIFAIGSNLYDFDEGTKSATLIAGGVQGVAGMSEDASRVYLASTQALSGGATAGKPNLYLAEGGTLSFIATLGPDASAILSPISNSPFWRASRVSPDGSRLVFMSRAPLTGYDNTDAVSGQADAEVFLYDAIAESGNGALRCVSCNPSQSRPTGAKLTRQGVGQYWAAAWIPTWPSQLYASRIISDDGNRVFFNSYDALVANDQDEVQDVYEWEAPGSGNCEVDGYAYVETASGCVNLISSGESPQGSEFVDAGVSGDDVFFKTFSSLVSQDPGLLDIYDARVEGGLPSPPPPAPEPPCEGEECMGSAGSEPDQPTPQSFTFVGPGNVVEKGSKPKKCPKGKHKARRMGKSVCVKNKKRHAKKSGRAGK